jgi:hypothetical protein
LFNTSWITAKMASLRSTLTAVKRSRELWRFRVTDKHQRHTGREAALASESNHCFVCGPANPIGLGVKFVLDGEICRGEFTPEPVHMGYRNVTHGGIVFSLLDELMIGTPVRLEGWCDKRKGRLAQMQGRVIRTADDFVVAEAGGAFMLNAS